MAEYELGKIFESLLEQMPLGIIITDTDGKICFVNKAAEEIRQVHRDALLDHSIMDCHPQAVHGRVSYAMDHLKSHPETPYTRMVEDHRQNKYYMNTYTGIRDGNDTVQGVAVLTNDITQQRQLEQENALLAQIQSETIRNLKVQYHKLLMGSLEAICSMQETKDPFLREHSKHVCDISLKMFEKKYGMRGDFLTLREAALLHDLGKLCIPDSIIDKTGPLTAEEYAIIKQHPDIAFKILEPIDSGALLSGAVRHHHERFDGKGYPDGLVGTDIPVFARIIAIADTFDAMHSDRPYRKALAYEQCTQEIARQSGLQFDPEWVEVFMELALTGSI